MSNADLEVTADDDPSARPLPAEIDATFAPRPRANVVSRRLDNELLLVDESDGRIHLLNATAATVWECLDGDVTLGELATELAEAFDAPLETVSVDALGIVRELGKRGLLANVALPALQLTPLLEPPSPGDRIEPFEVTTADGSSTPVPGSGAGGTLLVNWSPFCGYCGAITEQLAACREALGERGIDLVLLTIGGADDNARMLADRALMDLVRYRSEGAVAPGAALDSGAARRDPFGSMGTPAAYLLDASGVILEPLAMGAYEVPKLARVAAGLPPLATDAPRNALPAATGMCGPSIGPRKPSRQWAPTGAYAIGDEVVGIRADSVRTDDVLRRALAPYRLPDGAVAPANFSVVLGEVPTRAAGRASTLSLLLLADRTVLRSRSPRRVLRALGAHLSSLLETPDAELLRTTAVAGLIDGRVILLPSFAARRMESLQPRLARLGVALSDEPLSLVDPVTGELVIPAPSGIIASAVLDELPSAPSSRSELPPLEPGRYPIAAWVLDQDATNGSRTLTRAGAIAGALPAVRCSGEDVADAIDAIGQVFKTVRPIPLPLESVKDLAASLEAIITGL